MELLLVGLGALKLTQLAKEAVPLPMRPWTKSLVSLVSAGLLASLARQRVPDWALLSAGGAGLAAALHPVLRWAAAAGDECRLRVMLRAANPRRELR